MNVDLSKYSLFKGKIENLSLLPNQGFCNDNYSFSMNDKKYLLRKFKIQTVDRKREFKIQNLAYKQGIAAKAILLDEKNGLMICKFLEGHHKVLLERDDLNNVADLLKKLHMIQINTAVLNLEDLFDSKSQKLIEAIDTVKSYHIEHVLCHNDLNPKNILFSEGVKLIDWEFASINDKYFDLASFCLEFNLSEEDELYFLESYFSTDENIQREKLNAYKTIYTTLCKQWFEKSDINTPI